MAIDFASDINYDPTRAPRPEIGGGDLGPRPAGFGANPAASVRPSLAELEAANRAARVAKMGEEAVAKAEALAAKQATFFQGPSAASVGPSVATPAAETPGFLARGWGALKNLATTPISSKFAKGAGKTWLAAAPVVGAIEAATDSQENVNNLANSVGVDYNSFGGRIGSNVLNWLQKTGDVATLGGASALGRGIANVAGGENFFTPFTSSANHGAVPAKSGGPKSEAGSWADIPPWDNATVGTLPSQANTPVLVPPGSLRTTQGDIVPAGQFFGPTGSGGLIHRNAATPAELAMQKAAREQYLTPEQITDYEKNGKQPLPTNADHPEWEPRGPFEQGAWRVKLYGHGDSNIPASGTGVFTSGRGAVRVVGDPNAAPVTQVPVPVSPAAGAIGALMNIRERTGNAQLAQATNKMLLDYALKAPGAQESAAKAQLHAATLEQAQKAANAGASPSEISAILAGRPSPGRWTVPMGGVPIDTTKPTLTQDTRTGQLELRAPKKPFTKADLDANVKKSGKSAAQVIQDAINAGYTPDSGLGGFGAVQSPASTTPTYPRLSEQQKIDLHRNAPPGMQPETDFGGRYTGRYEPVGVMH